MHWKAKQALTFKEAALLTIFTFTPHGLVQGISIGGTQVGDLHVQLDGEGQNVQIRGIGSGPAGMFSMSGDAQTAGDWPLQLQGQYVSFRLDPWARLLLNNKLSAQVDCKWLLQGEWFPA